MQSTTRHLKTAIMTGTFAMLFAACGRAGTGAGEPDQGLDTLGAPTTLGMPTANTVAGATPPQTAPPTSEVVTGSNDVFVFRKEFMALLERSPIQLVPEDPSARLDDLDRIMRITSHHVAALVAESPYIVERNAGVEGLTDHAIEFWLHIPLSEMTTKAPAGEVVFFLATEPHNSDRLDTTRHDAGRVAMALPVGTPLAVFAVPEAAADGEPTSGPNTLRTPLEGFVMADGDGRPVTLAAAVEPGALGSAVSFEAVLERVQGL